MDVIATIITHTQPAELVKPTNRSLHNPAEDTQATAVGRSPLGKLGIDPAVTQLLAFRFVIKAPVAHGMVRAFAGVARLASDGRDGIDQGDGFMDVRRVRRDGVDDQGDALTVGEDGVFAAGFRAIDGAGAGFFTATDGADMGRVHDEPLEVDLIRLTEVGQQDLVDLIPDAGRLPVAQAVPTGHAAAAAHLLRQILPGQAGLEDKDDPGQDFAIVQEGASAFGLRGMRRDQRSNQFPEFVGKMVSLIDYTAIWSRAHMHKVGLVWDVPTLSPRWPDLATKPFWPPHRVREHHFDAR